LAPPGSARRAERALWIVVGISVAIVVATAALRAQANPILGAIVLSLVLVAARRTLLSWQTMLGALLVVILFIPIRRYEIAGGLPFELEPYRVLVAVVLGCWFCALAADPEVRWRKTGLEAPIVTLLVAMLLSMVLNVGRVSALSETVFKQLSFFVSYLLVLFFIVSVVARGRKLDRMLRLFVAGGTLLAVLSLIEWRTGTNMFNGLNRVLPFMQYVDFGDHVERGTGVRALGSAQHPIALGAALVMLIPLTVYLHRRDGRSWWLLCAALLTLGALSTGSRTAALMLIALLVSFLCIKPRESLRLLPMLIPLVIVIQGVMPGTLGTFRVILQPSYVIEEQSTEMGTGTGRIADLGPTLAQWSHNPFLGQGFGTRVLASELGTGGVGNVDGEQILDNQWLGWLLDVGAVGVLGLLWLFCRSIRRLAQRARSDTGPDGWLATSLAASLASFAIGMFTFDAFAFIQVTFFAFIVLGFAAVAMNSGAPLAGRSRAPAQAPTAAA
ncbi:MAG: O-antigen ligase family protein, partial [Thermoleophilaceae bacterium]